MRALTPAAVAVAVALTLTGCAAGTAAVATSTTPAPATVTAASASPGAAGGVALPDQATSVDGVEVAVSGVTVDTTGVRVTVTMDTHTGSLDGDLAASTLTVAGTPTGPATWQGDPPGSHHRSGQLTFPGASVGPGDDVAVTVAGLPGPVVFTWTVPASAGTAS